MIPISLHRAFAGSDDRRSGSPLWAAAGLAAQSATRFAINLLVGRLAGPATLSAVSTAMAVANYASLLGPTSSSSAASRFVAQHVGAGDYPAARQVARTITFEASALTALLSLGAGTLWYLISGPSHAVDAVIVALLTAGYSLLSLFRGVHFGIGRIRRSAVLDIMTSGIALLGVATVISFDAPGLWVLLPVALSYCLYAALSRVPRIETVGETHPVSGMRSFIAYSALGSMASAGFIQLSMICAQFIGDSRFESGQYAAALALATPASLVATTLGQVLFPSLARSIGRGSLEEVRSKTSQSVSMLLVVACPIFIGVALLSGPIVAVLFGSDFRMAGGILPVLLMGIMSTTISVPSVNYLATSTLTGAKYNMVASLLGLITGVCLWIALSEWGVLGTALGYVIGVMVTSWSIIVRSWRHGDFKWNGLPVRFLILYIMFAGASVLQFSGGLPTWQLAIATAVVLSAWFLSLRDKTIQLLGRLAITKRSRE